MSAEDPRTPAEWRAYLETEKDAEALYDKAASANQGPFIHGLLLEGYGPKDIETLFRLIAHRLVALGVSPPPGGWYNLRVLAREPLPMI